jgi:hypothetical protein
MFYIQYCCPLAPCLVTIKGLVLLSSSRVAPHFLENTERVAGQESVTRHRRGVSRRRLTFFFEQGKKNDANSLSATTTSSSIIMLSY